MFVCYLVDAVDLLGRVDHKPTSGAGLHGKRLSFPPKKISENYNVKGSQADGSQLSSADSWWLLDSRTGASLLVVNLALGLPNYESGFYMTPGFRSDQPPHPPTPPEDWLRSAVCLQDDKDRRTRGFRCQCTWIILMTPVMTLIYCVIVLLSSLRHCVSSREFNSWECHKDIQLI